jgi:uncharacterized protein (DUF1800 family)
MTADAESSRVEEPSPTGQSLQERAAARHEEGWRLVREATRLELLAARLPDVVAARLRAEAALLLAEGQRAMHEGLAHQAQASLEVAMQRQPALPPDLLQVAKVTRAVHSTRQLQEVMTDFWFNHFNVFSRKGRVGLALEDYEQQAIRAHVFGRFENMLAATARHPAMLMYLDAAVAAGDGTTSAGVVNENYARELLELHTLGVHGGYTQDDVEAVARAFTGWTVVEGQPALLRPGPAFAFHPRRHDGSRKVVLGRTLPAGRGIEDGLDVLRMLAHHPSTSNHLAYKLVRHFVADDPPPALVDEIAGVFRRTGGDLRAVTRALFTAEEFFQPEVVRAKVKRPFEFVASALRVSGADGSSLRELLPRLRALGHLPYDAAAPTGYPVTQEAWLSAGALLARMHFAEDLAAGRVPGLRTPLIEPGDAEGESGVDAAIRLPGALLPVLLPGVPVGHIEAVLLDAADDWIGPDAAATMATLLGIVLGSPEFQRY